MNKFTKERLEEIAELARKATYKRCAMHMTNLLAVCDSEVIEDMASQILDSMEQEPLYQVRHGDKWRDVERSQYDDHAAHGSPVRVVYAAPPAPLVDANGWLPCPFCNSPVKWCGENSADPDDDHVCHHIQCTNPECGADFDFTNTGDDLLTDDPAVLDSMTSVELLQPLRAVCKGRFNRRAALLQGSDGTLTNEGTIPVTQFKPVADLYGLTSPTGGETSFTFDAVEARDFIDGGWSCQEYVELERFQEAITNHTEDKLAMVDHSGDSNNTVEPVTTAYKLRDAVETIRNSGIAIDAEKILAERDALNAPDCWCRTCRPVTVTDMRFVVCPDCGNKRCPHANDHRHACTGSNEPGQEGSAYPAAPQQEVK